jgi:ribose transport system permease protein
MPDLPPVDLDRPDLATAAVVIEQATQPPVPPAPGSPHALAGAFSRLGLGRYWGLGMLAIVIAIFAVWIPDTFLTATTFKSIIAVQGVTALVALAVLFPLAGGVFDLSIPQTVGLSALMSGSLMANAPHLSPVLAIGLTLLMALVVGAFNGVLVAFVGVNSFIATLGTSSLLTAALGVIGHGDYVGPFPNSFSKLTSPNPLGIPMIAFYVLVVAFVTWYVLEHTPIGRRTFATGANPDAARLGGVRTRRYVFASLVVCAFGGGIAGVLLASSTGSVNETIGTPYLLPAYAAAFLSTTQFKPGRFNTWGTILAVVLLGTGVEGLQLVGAQVWVTDLFNGVALIGAVCVAVTLERLRGRRAKARTAAAG